MGMEFDGWIAGCKVRCFPWIDGKRIYLNVAYYAPGQSLCKPPVWERTAYIIGNEEGKRAVENNLETLVRYIETAPSNYFMPGTGLQIKVEGGGLL